MGKYIFDKLEIAGRYFAFLGELLRCTVKRPFHINQYLNEIVQLGINSLFVIILSSAAMGMIFALQVVEILQDFSAEIGTGAMVSVALALVVGVSWAGLPLVPQATPML